MKGAGRKIRRTLVCLCMLCLCGGINVWAAPESSNIFPFYEDGDVVGVIGDSITHVQYGPVSYIEALYHYYLCQFPQRRIEFRNLGTANSKASDILNIYDQDPAFCGLNKAIIMLGMNEAMLKIPVEEYIQGMEEIVNRLKADGLDGADILVLAPTPYDDTCALNYDRKGNPYRLIDHSLAEFTEHLAQKSVDWGVQYIDLHTPMVELSQKIQKDNPKNTLTRGDCIHPNITGQMLIAYYILAAQGATELEAETYAVKGEEVHAARGEATDLYWGERGVCWMQRQKSLPAALTGEFREYIDFFAPAVNLYQEQLRVEGFPEDNVYSVYMGEAELGSFSGKELEDGVNLALLETHPLQEAARRLDDISRTLHQKVMDYRGMWIGVATGETEYAEEEFKEAYERWRRDDTKLRDEMYALARESIGETFQMAVVERGYSVQELEQEKLEVKKAAEEQLVKEAQQIVRRTAAKRLEKAQKSEIRIFLIIAVILLVTATAGFYIVRKKKRKERFGSKKSIKYRQR